MLSSPLTAETDRILLVDDEIHLTNLWRLILEFTGRYTVREENRADRVLKTARQFRPDLIFMDRQLCGADGGEVAAEIEADPELCRIPIIFVTGSITQEEAVIQCVNIGVPTLAKPFGSEALPRLADAILLLHRHARRVLGRE